MTFQFIKNGKSCKEQSNHLLILLIFFWYSLSKLYEHIPTVCLDWRLFLCTCPQMQIFPYGAVCIAYIGNRLSRHDLTAFSGEHFGEMEIAHSIVYVGYCHIDARPFVFSYLEDDSYHHRIGWNQEYSE